MPRIPRLYQNVTLQNDNSLTLDTATTHRIRTVLRLREGAALRIFNGSIEVEATLMSYGKNNAIAELKGFCPTLPPSPCRIHLLQSWVRGEKMDWILQKATELGVHAITPLLTEHTERKYTAENFEKHHQHGYRIIVQACEQSGRCDVPQLNTAQTLSDYLQNCANPQHTILLEPGSALPLSTWAPASEISHTLDLLIGPEGGFSPRELAEAAKMGIAQRHLGPRVLRTETAPLAAITLLQAAFGDFSTCN